MTTMKRDINKRRSPRVSAARRDAFLKDTIRGQIPRARERQTVIYVADVVGDCCEETAMMMMTMTTNERADAAEAGKKSFSNGLKFHSAVSRCGRTEPEKERVREREREREP